MRIDWLSARYLGRQNRTPGRTAARIIAFVAPPIVITSGPFYRPASTETADQFRLSTQTADQFRLSTETADAFRGRNNEQVQ